LKEHVKKLPQPGKRGGIDIPFFVVVMLLLAFGLIMMFSASYAYSFYKYDGDSLYVIRNQFKYTLLGLAGMLFCIVADYRRLRHVSGMMLVMSFVLLVLVAIPGVGTVRNEARRWLFGFQPSEFTKLAIIVFFADSISRHQDVMHKFKTGVVPYILILGATAGLLYLEPHMSATILICGVGMIMILIGGAPFMPFGIMALVGGAGMAGMIALLPHARARMSIWLHPETDPLGSGYQILQSLYAIGSGGLFGLGLGQSRQKYLYIPEPHNDFIFAILCEELGYIGAIVVLTLFVLLIWRGFSIAFRAPDKFSSLLVMGIISLVAVQALLNIAVVTNTIPTTGIPMPFFSYGGTAMVMLLVEMGIVLNVSRYCNK
jgi:cell division protein FtsW